LILGILVEEIAFSLQNLQMRQVAEIADKNLSLHSFFGKLQYLLEEWFYKGQLHISVQTEFHKGLLDESPWGGDEIFLSNHVIEQSMDAAYLMMMMNDDDDGRTQGERALPLTDRSFKWQTTSALIM